MAPKIFHVCLTADRGALKRGGSTPGWCCSPGQPSQGYQLSNPPKEQRTFLLPPCSGPLESEGSEATTLRREREIVLAGGPLSCLGLGASTRWRWVCGALGKRCLALCQASRLREALAHTGTSLYPLAFTANLHARLHCINGIIELMLN